METKTGEGRCLENSIFLLFLSFLRALSAGLVVKGKRSQRQREK